MFRKTLENPSYEVSNYGNVRSWIDSHGGRREYPRRLSICANSRGYLLVRLSINKKMVSYHAHTLELNAFVGPRPEGMVCRHLDGNKLNNYLWNLKWGTYKENEHDKVLHGTRARGSKVGRSILKEEDIPIIKALYSSGTTQGNLAKMYGTTQSNISAVITRTNWKHI